MSDWTVLRPWDHTIGGWLSPELVGSNTAGPSTAAWPLANLAIFLPIRVPVPCTVYKLATGAGSTAGGNFDIGLYDSAGNRLVSSGATARTNSVELVVDVTDTRIGPGTYYLALAADGTANYSLYSVSTAPKGKLLGAFEATSAYVLPATVTYATFTRTAVPALSAYLRAY